MLKKRAGEGIIVEIIVLLSLVVCISSVYLFVMGNQNRVQSLESKPNNYESSSEEPEVVENLSLAEAISDLKRDGCQIINVKATVYLDNPRHVSYKEFKLKALENLIVVASPSNSGTFLLIQIKSIQWVWIPS